MDKTKSTFVVVLLFLFVGFLAYSFVVRTSEQKTETKKGETYNVNAQKDNTILLPIQVNEEGPVSVSIQPLMSSFDTQELWKFEVVLSTHSVELTTDLMDSVVLIDNSGNEYKPIRWEGDPPGGHHREAVVFFNPVIEYSISIVVLARDIGDIPERKFMWTTQP